MRHALPLEIPPADAYIRSGGAALKSEIVRLAFGPTRIDGGGSRVVERRKVYDWDEA